MPVIGLFKPEVRELNEMRFQWDRPYGVDASTFSHRFWSDATPFEEGLRTTIGSYRCAKRDACRNRHDKRAAAPIPCWLVTVIIELI